MAEDIKMTKDNMDIWFEKRGYIKITESVVATLYKKQSTNKSQMLTIVNDTKNEPSVPDYFRYSVCAQNVDTKGNISWSYIPNDILEHLQTKASILMKKFMQDAIKSEYPHVAKHGTLGGDMG